MLLFSGYTNKLFPITGVVIERNNKGVGVAYDPKDVMNFCTGDIIHLEQEIERLRPVEIVAERIIVSGDGESEYAVSAAEKSIDRSRLGIKRVIADFPIIPALIYDKEYYLQVKVKYYFPLNLVSTYFPFRTESQKLKFVVDQYCYEPIP